MWDGKNKAVTFSFDDNCESDKKLIKIFNKYGIKATFNINSGLLGVPYVSRDSNGNAYEIVPKLLANQVKSVYSGHEIAVHSVNHFLLTDLMEEKIVFELEYDRKVLEQICEYHIVGMAYPGGTHDARVKDIIMRRTPLKYGRTIDATHNFDLQKNLLEFNPTMHFMDKMNFELINKFLESDTDKKQLMYIWGHAFELDRNNGAGWELIEKICQMLSFNNSIFYGTNKEVLLDK